MQPIAARRAGRLSPWQDQPEIRKLGSSMRLMKPRQARASSAPPARRSSVTGPNLLSMMPGGFQLARAVRVHPGGDVGDGGAGLIDFAARAIDFELGDRLAVGAAPAEDVLAAALGMPEDLVSLCFVVENRTG